MNKLQRDDILKILKNIINPINNINIVDDDLIKFLVFSEHSIRFVLEFIDNYEEKNALQIKEECVMLLEKYFTDINIQIAHNTHEQHTKKKFKNPIKIPNIKKIILVISGKGGVGKSTIAVNLATYLAQSNRVGLLDADIFGPSIAHMLNCKEYPDFNQEEKIIPLTKHNLKFISMGNLLTQERATVWRGPMASKAITKMFVDVEWGDLDYLIVDMPPGTSDIHITITENFLVDQAIVVTTEQKIALLDAIKAIDMMNLLNIKITGIVKNMSFFVDDLGNHRKFFGNNSLEDVCQKFSLKVLTEIPLLEKISSGNDSGIPLVLDDVNFSDYFQQIIDNF